MPIHRYTGELREGRVFVAKAEDAGVIAREDGVMGVSIVGVGEPDELAREAAEVHFRTHPERTKVFIVVSSRASDDRWDGP